MPVPALPPAQAPLHDVDGSGSLVGLMRASEVARLAAGAAVAHAPNPQFFLRHHPRGWEIGVVKGEVEGVKLDGTYWLPQLSLFTILPGASGCRTRGRHEAAEQVYLRAVMSERERGWTFIDPSTPIPAACLPTGIPAGGYLRELPCVDPKTGVRGVFHVEAWNVPHEVAPGEPHRLAFDHATYNLWRAWLVLTGQVTTPGRAVIEDIARRLQGRVERAELLDLPEEIRQRRVTAARTQLEATTTAKPPARAAAKAKADA